jgi:hypothetical protein
VIVALLIIVVAALVAAVAFWAGRRGRRRGALDGPVCGACRYSVVGLEVLTCPECGGDLRAVGIRTPNEPRRPVPWWEFAAQVLLFSLLALVAAAPGVAAVDAIAPVRRTYASQVLLSRPASGLYDRVTIRANETAWDLRQPVPPVTVELVPLNAAAPAAGPLTVEPADGGYHYVDTSGRRVSAPSGFAGGTVLAWLATAGFDPADPRLIEEAGKIAVEARNVGRIIEPIQGRGSRSSTGGGSQLRGTFGVTDFRERATAEGLVWLVAVAVGFWVLLWAGGVVYLWRVHSGRSGRRNPEP